MFQRDLARCHMSDAGSKKTVTSDLSSDWKWLIDIGATTLWDPWDASPQLLRMWAKDYLVPPTFTSGCILLHSPYSNERPD